MDFLIVAITIIVVAVPEGLPLAVTISLAYSQGKMQEDNNLVRHLEACETMGGATQICSDKTGTLTENLMTVVELYCNEQSFTQFPSRPSGEVWHKLVEGCSVNSTAYIIKKEGEKDIQVGSKTECALLNLVASLGMDYKVERKRLEIIKQWPFSSLKKRMSTLIKDGNVSQPNKFQISNNFSSAKWFLFRFLIDQKHDSLFKRSIRNHSPRFHSRDRQIGKCSFN